jgi:hypothetical protein
MKAQGKLRIGGCHPLPQMKVSGSRGNGQKRGEATQKKEVVKIH